MCSVAPLAPGGIMTTISRMKHTHTHTHTQTWTVLEGGLSVTTGLLYEV